MLERRYTLVSVPAALPLALVLVIACVGAPAAASAQVFAEELRIEGAWVDAALSLGGGIGVGNDLDSNVFGRLRLGALYAYEPWIVNLGVTGELGALAERGVGAELEVNHFGGPWAQFGISRVLDAQWMSHLALGFAVFGVEWQHRLGTPSRHAVLFLLRAPIGIWWFLLRDHDARARRQREPAEASEPDHG